MTDCVNEGGVTCQGMSSKTHEEIVIKLTKIEVGQEHLFNGLVSLNAAVSKISVQEERQITMQLRLDAAWNRLDALKTAHDKCPVENVKTQVGWIWVFLSGLGLGLAMLFISSLLQGK